MNYDETKHVFCPQCENSNEKNKRFKAPPLSRLTATNPRNVSMATFKRGLTTIGCHSRWSHGLRGTEEVVLIAMATAEQLEIPPSSGENLENRTIMVASEVEFKKQQEEKGKIFGIKK